MHHHKRNHHTGRMGTRRPAVLTLAGVGVALAGMALSAGGCVKEPPARQDEKPVAVRTVTVKLQPLVLPVRTSGRLYSQTESKLSFMTGGIIQRIYVEEGQQVKKGTELARLDPGEIEAQVRRAELAVKKSRRDYIRTQNLYKDSVATLEQYQDARTGLDMAESALRIARFNLEHSRITAPSEGKILKKACEEHEIVGPGQPVLLFASTEAGWVVRTSLADKDIVRISLGDSASVGFDAWPGQTFSCRVSSVGDAADPYTGTYEAELLLEEAPEKLVSGFMARTEIYPARSMSCILLPVEAIIEGKGKEAAVYLYKKGSVERRNVKFSAITDRGMVVEKGLLPGDEVIVEGGSFVRAGAPVERINDTTH